MGEYYHSTPRIPAVQNERSYPSAATHACVARKGITSVRCLIERRNEWWEARHGELQAVRGEQTANCKLQTANAVP